MLSGGCEGFVQALAVLFCTPRSGLWAQLDVGTVTPYSAPAWLPSTVPSEALHPLPVQPLSPSSIASWAAKTQESGGLELAQHHVGTRPV